MRKILKNPILLLVFVCLMMPACSDGSNDTAIISISIDQAPDKAAWDVSISQLRHIITLSGPTGAKTLSISGAGTVSASVVPGTWRVSAEGYLGDELYSVGSTSAEVKARQNTNVIIQMNVVWAGAGNGGGSVNNVFSPSYGISLDKNGTYNFAAASVGYSPLTPLTVNVTNNGTADTGVLSLALSGANYDSFSLNLSASVPDIAPGQTGNFTVVPNTGLAIGVYTATVTVTGGSTLSASLNVRFEVTTLMEYGISMSQTGTYNFPTGATGYSARTPVNVIITNIGTANTGTLNAALSGANSGSFTLSAANVPNITPGLTGNFTVVPHTGLAVGAYTATVTVIGENGINASFNVSFEVLTSLNTDDISLDQSGIYTFPSAKTGYVTLTPLTVTVTNIGTNPTGTVSINLSGANPGSFTLSSSSILGLAVDSNDTFTVVPNPSLAVGTYTAIVDVSASPAPTVSFSVSFEVLPSSALSGTITITASGGVNSDQCSVTGQWIQGQTLTASFSGNGDGSASWEWKDDTSTTISATDTYSIQATDIGKAYSVEVSYGGTSGTVSMVIPIHPGTPITSVSQVTNASGNYILTSNCTASTPINIADFAGTFDGNGKTIAIDIGIVSIYVNAGLFQGISTGAVVKNFKLTRASSSSSVQNSYTAGSNQSTWVGAVAGYNSGTIKNVSSTVGIVSNQHSNGYSNAGGITGENKGTIINCYHNDNVSSQYAPNNNSFIGGIVGRNNGGTVRYCISSGGISDTTTGGNINRYAGGIDGRNSGWLDANVVTGGSIKITNSGIAVAAGFISTSNGNGNYYYQGVTISVSGSQNNDGTSISPASATQTWWQGIWSSAWGGADEDHPWVWGGSQPKLWFE